MTLKHYPVRALKAILQCLLLALLVFGIAWFLGREQQTIGFWEMVQKSNPVKIVIFLGVFGLCYPLIGYIRQRVLLAHPLTAAEKEAIIKLFAELRFKLTAEEDGKLFFRTVNPVARITRMFEDTIEVDYTSGTQLTVEGLRRDTYRLSKSTEWQLRKMRKEEN